MPIPKALPIGILPPFLKSPLRRDGVSPYQMDLGSADDDRGARDRLEALKKGAS